MQRNEVEVFPLSCRACRHHSFRNHRCRLGENEYLSLLCDFFEPLPETGVQVKETEETSSRKEARAMGIGYIGPEGLGLALRRNRKKEERT